MTKLVEMRKVAEATAAAALPLTPHLTVRGSFASIRLTSLLTELSACRVKRAGARRVESIHVSKVDAIARV